MINVSIKTEFNDQDYETLSQICRSCTRCELSKTRTNVVIGSGPVTCDVMIIGEGPGEKEDLQGKPFVGKSGHLLTKILDSIGIDKEKDVYIANTVKCRPPKNRTPYLKEIEACKPFLIRQLQLVQPKILLCLGAPSLKTIIEEKLPISKVRGNWYQAPVQYMAAPLHIMPIFHPSYLLRNQSKKKGSPKWLTWQDIQEVQLALRYYNELTISYKEY